MTDPKPGLPGIFYRFVVRCVQCDEGDETTLGQVDLTGYHREQANIHRANWKAAHAAATGHTHFENGDMRVIREELLLPPGHVVGAALPGSRKELEA